MRILATVWALSLAAAHPLALAVGGGDWPDDNDESPWHLELVEGLYGRGRGRGFMRSWSRVFVRLLVLIRVVLVRRLVKCALRLS